MEITTEELLEEHDLSSLTLRVLDDLSILERKNNKDNLIGRNKYCGITKIPDGTKKANMLLVEFLRLAKEKKLDRLMKLRFFVKKITSLPIEIWQLTNLTSLGFGAIGLTSLPATIEQMVNLTVLDLSRNQLVSLPDELWQLTNLTRLSLYANQLTYLPNKSGQLTNLVRLLLFENQLTNLPAEIGELTNLTSLNLSRNKLINLPVEIGQLNNLTSLNLHNNQLAKIPSEIGQLNNLISLDLHNNELVSIPAEIGQLTKLISLDLYNNQLVSLPCEIGQLTNLSSFYLFYNHLANLPIEIQNLKSLKELDLRENPLDFPFEILENIKEPQTILDYFAWTLNGKRKPIAETKLLVLGQGTVGKTSLIQRIVHDRFDEHENKTEGITIEHWTVDDETVDGGSLTVKGDDLLLSTVNGPPSISINIWDFGGQEIMHATHQFFLTKRSLYLLVLDSRSTQEENRVEYWLKIIQSFGGESPVLLVGNKSDQHPLDIDRSGLQKKYPNIVGILETSAATGAGIDALKAIICEQVNKLPHVRDMLPESWFNVKQRLEAQRAQSNFITLGKYTELCAESEIRDESSQRTLIGFLHDLGVVLHFQDDARLEALGILNPQWVTNGVYKIINTRSVMENRGVLTVAMLNEILNLPEEYPRDKRLFMVDMMKKFELCYALEADKSFLVPDLLPKEEPDLDFQGTPAFEYLYPVLPSSVMTRFIVRMSAKIEAGQVWRSGVLLKIAGNRALVKGDVEDRAVSIRIDGMEHTRRDALAAIRYQLDEIHASIKGLNPEKLVPVPDAVQAKPLKYDYLLKLERAGEETLLVEDGDDLKKINVSQMLNGVESEYERKQAGSGPHIHIEKDVSGNIIVGNNNRL